MGDVQASYTLVLKVGENENPLELRLASDAALFLIGDDTLARVAPPPPPVASRGPYALTLNLI